MSIGSKAALASMPVIEKHIEPEPSWEPGEKHCWMCNMLRNSSKMEIE
jgi:hypothetical protein